MPPYRFSVRVTLALCVLPCALTACTRDPNAQVVNHVVTYNGMTVVDRSTPDFARVSASLPISREEAALNLVDHLETGPHSADRETWAESLLQAQRHIVDESYFFPIGREKTGFTLDGYYVDGRTGEVTQQALGVIPTRMADEHGWDTRFDLP